MSLVNRSSRLGGAALAIVLLALLIVIPAGARPKAPAAPTATTTVPQGNDLLVVTCPATTLCKAVGSGGAIVRKVKLPTRATAGSRDGTRLPKYALGAQSGPTKPGVRRAVKFDGSDQAQAKETVGLHNVVFSEDFDGVHAPTLPAGWSAASSPGPLWVTSSSGSPAPPADTAPNAAFVDDPATVTDKQLTSPLITAPTDSPKLSFRNNYNLEANFDGGVLEISINGGAFTDILAAGGSFVTGGYSGTIDPTATSYLAGRAAWTGNSGGFVTTTVDLPAAAAGQNIQLRWRMASDDFVGGQGWRVDSVTLCGGLGCNPTAISVASIRARPVPAGVLIRWRTFAAARLLGFDVFGQTSTGRTKLNGSLIAARQTAHTYSYLVKRAAALGTTAYWIRAARLDGSRIWYGRSA